MNQLASVETGNGGYNLPTFGMAPGLAIMFDEKLYARCQDIAINMSKAEGIVPKHLIGKPVSCFAVLTRSITWKLDPFAVAQCTWETPGGKIGYEGKLIQAILEQSGQLVGGVKYELFGDWDRIRGRFKKEKSQKGNDYFVPAWDPNKDEEGLGVKVSARVKGEVEPRTEEFFLKSFWPRNSTLWATRPDQQIKYASGRAFANLAMPGILMGVPFVDDDPGVGMRDITPKRPTPGDFMNSGTSGAETVDWSKAGQVEASTDEVATSEDDQGEHQEQTPAEETHAPFGQDDARKLGIEYRDQNRPMSAPRDLEPNFHEAFLNGWRDRDNQLARETKNNKK